MRRALLPLFLVAACGGVDRPDSAEAPGAPLGKADAPREVGWSREDALPRALDEVYLPELYADGVEGELEGVDGTPIRYVKLERADERGALVIVNGRTESYVKYAELVHDLRRLGFSLYLLDHRGQGFSGRLLADRDRGHVARFEDYVEDLGRFMDQVVNARTHARTYALAHSMGGTMVALYAEAHPTAFDKIVLSCPMLELDASPLSEGAALTISATMVTLGFGTSYAPGQGPFDAAKPNENSHSAARFAMNRQLQAAFPEIQLGGATWRWLHESLRASRRARAEARALVTPTLLFQGTDDTAVRPAGQDTLCAEASRCQRVVVPGAGHELLMERDALRSPALDRIRAFLE